jgi:NTE family protein
MSVALVLGGGGVTGLAYHAGALAALEHDTGWDPRTADLIVGTSAGALVGALLRRGVPASDLAAMSVGGRTHATPALITAAASERNEFPAVTLRTLLRPPRVPSAAVVRTWIRRPWRVDPALAVAGMIADGAIDLETHAASYAEALGDAWPDDPLWLCAVRRSDLARVAFGRKVTPSLARAAMASCAIPGYFAPVEIMGQQYFDGGVCSPTNADVVRREPFDLVVIVSPMSARDGAPRGVGGAIRRYAQRKVRHEQRVLAEAGIASIVLEPGVEAASVLGTDFMSDVRVNDIVGSAFLDVGEQLDEPETRAYLDALGSSASRLRRRRWRAQLPA